MRGHCSGYTMVDKSLIRPSRALAEKCQDCRQTGTIFENDETTPIHRALEPRLIHLKTHPIVDLVVGKRDVVLIYGVPFLELDLAPVRTGLCGDELLKVAHGVVWAAFDAYFASQAIISNDFDKSHDGAVLLES